MIIITAYYFLKKFFLNNNQQIYSAPFFFCSKHKTSVKFFASEFFPSINFSRKLTLMNQFFFFRQQLILYIWKHCQNNWEVLKWVLPSSPSLSPKRHWKNMILQFLHRTPKTKCRNGKNRNIIGKFSRFREQQRACVLWNLLWLPFENQLIEWLWKKRLAG